MILAQVGEDQYPKADTEQALERRSVRGGFERARAVARLEHLAEGSLEVDRLAGRTDGGATLASDPVLDRAEEAGTAAGRREDREEEEGGRRLPVRACGAGDFELARRLSEEGIGCKGHGLPGVADEELGHRQIERALDDERDRTVGNGVGGKIVAVGLVAGHADEERPGSDAARVVGEVGDLDAGGVYGALCAHGLAHAVEVDGVGF
jgi:hypothetical protein